MGQPIDRSSQTVDVARYLRITETRQNPNERQQMAILCAGDTTASGKLSLAHGGLAHEARYTGKSHICGCVFRNPKGTNLILAVTRTLP